MMLTAAVAIDKWKLAIFKRHLDAAGYAYTEGPGLTADMLILKVKTVSVSALGQVVLAANRECKN